MKNRWLAVGLWLFALLGSSAFAEDITLCENPWTGSAVNAQVAKVLLEDMGHSVEIVSIDENSMWAALAAGELSACLEVWPSGHQENIAQFIEDKGVVDSLGELGVVGKISWYIPTYMLADKPELATWEGFTDAENAQLFATAQTGDKGQFIGGDPSFVQYDADIIENLGMELEVVYAGSEQAELAALDAAYSREDPFLFYFWTPHSVHSKYDLTAVELPEYTDECYAAADSGGVACDYPADVLMKIAYPGLKESAPDAYELLANLNYSNEDQIGMIAAVDEEGMSVEDAVQAWLDANEDVWSAWTP